LEKKYRKISLPRNELLSDETSHTFGAQNTAPEMWAEGINRQFPGRRNGMITFVLGAWVGTLVGFTLAGLFGGAKKMEAAANQEDCK